MEFAIKSRLIRLISLVVNWNIKCEGFFVRNVFFFTKILYRNFDTKVTDWQLVVYIQWLLEWFLARPTNQEKHPQPSTNPLRQPETIHYKKYIHWEWRNKSEGPKGSPILLYIIKVWQINKCKKWPLKWLKKIHNMPTLSIWFPILPIYIKQIF